MYELDRTDSGVGDSGCTFISCKHCDTYGRENQNHHKCAGNPICLYLVATGARGTGGPWRY